jgi:prepilin-type N-terminal cleavage/methylation domain-containing protein
MSIRLIKRGQSGDTIIEVMFAMAIIGIVLAAAYATASKNLQVSQLAKERGQASAIAESQLEQLKALETPPDTTDPFCLNIELAAAVISVPDATCVESFFSKSIVKEGNRYKIVVEWTPPGGTDANRANVTMYYSDFNFALTGSDNLSLSALTSNPAGVLLGASILNENSILSSGIVFSLGNNPRVGDGSSTVLLSSPTSANFQKLVSLATFPAFNPNVIYYGRTFVTTPNGIFYSTPTRFSGTIVIIPPATAPVIESLSNNPDSSSALITGVVNNSGSNVTSRVIRYYRTGNPASAREVYPNSDSFSIILPSLLPGVSYTYELTVQNGVGSDSSGPQTFTTDAITTPNVVQLGGEFNGSTYYISNNLVSWTVAKQSAEAMGGHLVTFSSAAENNYVSSRFPQTSWIGLSDTRIEGVWEWVTGEPFNYISWSTGEPNNYQWTPAGQDYAITNWASGSGLWDDQGNNEVHRYVVEFDSVPRATSRLGTDYNNCSDLNGTNVTCFKSAGSVYGCDNYNARYIFNPSGVANYNAVILNYGDWACNNSPTPPNNLYKFNVNVYINGQLNVANYQLPTNTTLATIPITPPATGGISSVNIEWTNNQWVPSNANPLYDPDFTINNIAVGYQ